MWGDVINEIKDTIEKITDKENEITIIGATRACHFSEEFGVVRVIRDKESHNEFASRTVNLER